MLTRAQGAPLLRGQPFYFLANHALFAQPPCRVGHFRSLGANTRLFLGRTVFSHDLKPFGFCTHEQHTQPNLLFSTHRLYGVGLRPLLSQTARVDVTEGPKSWKVALGGFLRVLHLDGALWSVAVCPAFAELFVEGPGQNEKFLDFIGSSKQIYGLFVDRSLGDGNYIKAATTHKLSCR